MIKRSVPRSSATRLPEARNLTTSENAVFTAALKSIEADYQVICSVAEKLRELERNPPQISSSRSETPAFGESDSPGMESPWEVCAALMRLDNNEVTLCKRLAEHGVEYAVIDQSPAAGRYGKSVGHLDILQTSDNPQRVLSEYLRSERKALELMTNDVTAAVRLFVSEQFPRHDVSRVVTLITRMCKNAVRIGTSETQSQTNQQISRRGIGV